MTAPVLVGLQDREGLGEHPVDVGPPPAVTPPERGRGNPPRLGGAESYEDLRPPVLGEDGGEKGTLTRGTCVFAMVHATSSIFT